MVPLVYCTVLRTLKPCDWPLPSIPFHFFCACVCVHSSDSEPRTLAPCLNLDATPRISMTSTLTFLPPKAASKQASKRALFMTSPHHSPVRWKCDLLFYSSYPVPLNCLFLFLYIVFLLMLLLKRSLVQIPRAFKIHFQSKNCIPHWRNCYIPNHFPSFGRGSRPKNTRR